MEIKNSRWFTFIRNWFRRAAKKDLQEKSADGVVVVCLIVTEIDTQQESSCPSNYDAAEQTHRWQSAFAKEREIRWPLRSLFQLTIKQIFVSGEILKEQLCDQKRKARREMLDRDKDSRRKWIVSSQQEMRKKRRELVAKEYESMQNTESFAEYTKIRRKTNERMAIEYQEMNMNEELASIVTCQKECGEEDNTKEDDSAIESDHGEYIIKDHQDNGYTELLQNDLCLKKETEHKINVFNEIQWICFERKTDEIKCRGHKDVNTHELLADSDTFKECSIANQKDQILPKQAKREKSKNETSVWRTQLEKRRWLHELIKLVFVMHIIPSVCGATFHKKLNVSNSVLEQPLLLTRYCNHETLYTLNTKCPSNEDTLNTLVESCEFEEICHSEEKPVCINIQDASVFVCLRKDLKCAKGYRLRPWVEEKKQNVVYLQKEKCPDGTYQMYESDCIHACLDRHRDIDHISEKYILHSTGDNISPATVYCNYKKGFFNGEGKFLLYYDIEEIYKPYFCDNINDKQPCKGGQYPLPNGSCVDHCQHGLERNVPDFVCRQKVITSSGSIVTPAPPHVTRTPTSFYTSTSQEEVTTQQTDEGNNNYDDKPSKEFPWWGYLAIIGVFCGGFVMIVVRHIRKRDTCSRLNECLGYPTARSEGSDIISENRSDSFQDSLQSEIINLDGADDQRRVENASNAILPQNESPLQDQSRRSTMGPRKVVNNHNTKIRSQSIYINATNVTLQSNNGLSSSCVESKSLLQDENGMDASDTSLELQENGYLGENDEDERFLTDNSSI